jgi:hypothetical protein
MFFYRDATTVVTVALVLAFIVWYVYQRTQIARAAERKEMKDWGEALLKCMKKKDMSGFPASVSVKGIYRRMKLIEKMGIDADVSHDKDWFFLTYRGHHCTLAIN